MSSERRRDLMGAKKGDGVFGVFGDYMFSNPLVYENGRFRVQETWNEVNSYQSVSGKNEGSTYFTAGDVSDINSNNPLSYKKYNDWVVPSIDALMTLIGVGDEPIIQRNGSTVNGNTGKHYSRIVTNITYAGGSNMGGYLFFPDDEVITGKSLSAFDSSTQAASGVTGDELNEYLNQGCIFLPFSGMYTKSVFSYSWSFRGSDGYIWSSTLESGNQQYLIRYSYSSPSRTSYTRIETNYGGYWFPVILCRNA